VRQKFKKTACPLRGASILTAIVHSAVWSLVEMERWLICVNKFFHFALKHYYISKAVEFSGAHCVNINLYEAQIKVYF
jgi:hypothetical protein